MIPAAAIHPHQQATVDRTTAHFQAQPHVLALILAGSIAHGLHTAASDVDVLVVVTGEDYQRRRARQELAFVNHDLATYPGGYVDGKYLDESFLDEVERRGSEPARFAFADARILFSRLDGLPARLGRIARYPAEEKVARIMRFQAQFEAWRWFAGEAAKKQDPYLATTAVARLLLFGGRMLLAHNEVLYPFHKWFLAALERAPDKPAGLLELMHEAAAAPTPGNAARFYELVKGHREWEGSSLASWGNRFLDDVEQTWLRGAPAIEDV